MNKFVLPVLGLLFLSGVVSAYQINIDAPDRLALGKPLIITGTTNFWQGMRIDVVLYRQLTTSTAIDRKIAYVLADGTFRVVFDTTSLEKGTYKIEVPASGLGESVNMRIVELVDRTDEISLTSTRQAYTGKLLISGTLENNRNAGVQIEVAAPDGERIFGPQYIATNFQGFFSTEIPISAAGTYDISFTDTKGYVGTKSITVTGNFPNQQETKAPVTTVTASTPILSAHSKATRDTPAFFEVKAGFGEVRVYTSSHTDWVMEYVDEKGILHMVNDHGEINPEEIEVQSRGTPLYFKVYPYRYSDSGDVFLYAENAQSVKKSTVIPPVFGGSLPASETPAETPASSPSVAACCGAVLLFLILRHWS